jgi:branched-subunit amino acid aminotransferase/4-amino-4-deoxychorismate lyase
VSIEQTPIELEPIRKQVAISAVRTNSRNVLLQHKTTARAVYEREYSQAQSRGLFDVLFVNERGEVTEASRANVFVRLNGGWYTPPVSSGLLGGLMRERVLSNPRRGAGERIIHAEELRLAERIVLTNAIYRITEVELVSSDRFETAGNDRSPRGGLQEAREGIQTGGGL